MSEREGEGERERQRGRQRGREGENAYNPINQHQVHVNTHDCLSTFPVMAFHTLSVLSSDPLTTRLPENCKQVTYREGYIHCLNKTNSITKDTWQCPNDEPHTPCSQ